MFDGSHRSRRAINLGGGSSGSSRSRSARRRARTSASASSAPLQTSTTAAGIQDYKSLVLQSTLRQREERRQVQLQQQSARCIQRVYRGRLLRRKVALWLMATLDDAAEENRKQHSQHTNKRTPASAIVSMRLSPPLRPLLTVPVEQVLLDYYNQISASQSLPSELTSVAVRRILPEVCRQVIASTCTRTAATSTRFSSSMQQLLRTLIEATAAQPRTVQTAGQQRDAFIAMCTTCQELLSMSSHSLDANNNHQNDHDDALWSSSLALFLWQHACTTVATATAMHGTSNQTAAVALLAVTLFGYANVNTTNANAANSISQQQQLRHLVASCPITLDVMLTALVQCVTTTGFVNDNNDLVTTVKRRLQGREGTVLVNAIELLYSNDDATSMTCTPQQTTVLPLMQHVLSTQPMVATLATMVANKGEHAVKKLLFTRRTAEEQATAMQVDDDGSTSSSDDEDSYHVRAPFSATANQQGRKKAVSSSASRLTRAQLQTTSKLDRLYQDQVILGQERQVLQQVQRMDVVEVSHVLNVAIHIANPALWKTWGTTVLLNPSSTEEVTTARQSFIAVLGHLLAPCTGLRTIPSTTTSPLLSQLSFSNDLLQALWRNVLVMVTNNHADDSRQGTTTSTLIVATTTLFCNIFAHHLIALGDDEFLAKYTTMNGSQVILAEHVIVHLRTMLHDLYWSKPVLAQDVSFSSSSILSSNDNDDILKAHRARLLLAGTKLWNSLYERWCRLVRIAPFCDEATWWFPRLVSRRDDRAAVIDIRHNGGPQDNDDEMIDDDDHDDNSVASMMEVDGRPSDAEVQTDALADSFHDPKMARILTCIPQALPFERRVKLFSSLLAADKLKTQDETAEFRNAVRRMMEQGREVDDSIALAGRERVEIRRGALYGDSKEQLSQLGNRLKHKVQVTFINRHGAPEAGIDGGGVFKEFLDDLIKEAFDPSQHKTGAPTLFSVTPSETLAVNMATARSQEALPHYEFLGRVLGKAMYESILVEPQFCLPFLNQLLGKQNTLEDLKNLDNEYYSNLTKLRTLSAAEIDSLGMTFELTLDSGNGTARTVELLPGGSLTPVTQDNVIQYVHLVAHQRLNIEGARPTRAFLRGFRDLIPASWVRLFSSYELQKMISGDDTVRGIDVSSLKVAMQYAGGYHPSQPTVQWFWEVVEEMTPDQQRKLLRFMTSCSRQPLLGFQSLAPAPCIQQVRLPDEMFRGGAADTAKIVPLPTSATCMNLLKLPNYRDKELLRSKLMASIESGAGFELS